MNCKSMNVVIHNNKDPINVKYNKNGGLQELKIEGNLLTIKGGNTVTLPMVETEAITEDIASINNDIAQMNAILSDDIYYLKETVKYFLTEQQIKDIINATVGRDIDDLRRTNDDFFDEIEMANRSISQIRTGLLTEYQVKALIKAALSNLVNAEEVRY
ncbi:hypothetical protein [Veillonella seminalis]|uniref:Uncharacterized protein n=1 Tax=Veillonella seminalis ACS-216-V-Col6b TaxID=883156 RepID=K9D256_9FIRM|nr:hypothetical protein [Veillonella seminalis]EKU78353.1 hypothetical protein HMPREF9282_01259 [Veillonella seminalis ACS-216-V-Col6b]